MKFAPCAPEPQHGIVKSWMSEAGHYQLDLYRVIFGYRVRLREAGAECYCLDYCAGANQTWIDAMVAVMRRILEHVPEETPVHKISPMFPSFDRKPMVNDPVCWNKLLDLAHVESRDLNDLADLDL